MSIDRNTNQCWSQEIHFGFFSFLCWCPHYLKKVGFFTCLFNYFFKSKTLLDSYCFVGTDWIIKAASVCNIQNYLS